jgi:iron complex outermembrane receptor protein
MIWNQAQLQTGLSGTSGILNVGNVTGDGVELYVNWRTPITGLNVQFAGGVNKTTLSHIDPNILAHLTFLSNGEQLPPVPKDDAAIMFSYEHPTNYHEATFIADGRYQYRSKEKDLSTTLTSADLNLIDLDAGFRKGNYTLQVFVDNLTDDKGPSVWEEGRLLMPFPRTVGVRFAFKGF